MRTVFILLALVLGTQAAWSGKGYGEGGRRGLAGVVYNEPTMYSAAIYIDLMPPSKKGTIPPDPCGNFQVVAGQSYIDVGQGITKALDGDVSTTPCEENPGSRVLTIQLTTIALSAGSALAQGTAVVQSVNSGAFAAQLAAMGLVGYTPISARVAGVNKVGHK